MKTSDSYKNVLAALAKARTNIGPIRKDADNPYFHSKYATLGAIMEAVTPALRAEGIEVIQTSSGDGQSASVYTALVHVATGEYVEGVVVVPMPAEKATAQAVGSAISYARRYGLSTMVGVVADEDDDGNAASGPPKIGVPAKAPFSPPKEAPKAPAADNRLEDIKVIISRLGYGDEDKRKLWKAQGGDLDAILEFLKQAEKDAKGRKEPVF